MPKGGGRGRGFRERGPGPASFSLAMRETTNPGERDMALIKCPDCGTEISDQASACPKCARPMTTVQGQAVKQRSTPTTTGAVLGFIVGFALVWGGCWIGRPMGTSEIMTCSFGGALFAILGAILGAITSKK